MTSAARIVEVSPSAELDLDHGRFTVTSFLIAEGNHRDSHLLLTLGRPAAGSLLRIASACVTSEVFGCRRCDCSRQLTQALGAIAEEGEGVLTYHPPDEGYGFGLHEKIRSYAEGAGSTGVGGNHGMNGQDRRTFLPAALIVAHLGLTSVRLLSANERKREALRGHGIDAELLPLQVPVSKSPAPGNGSLRGGTA